MSPRPETAPPRPISPGDVVAGYSDELGEWTAAQVTHLDPNWRKAGVLHLDWSGPEPFSIDDLGCLEPLRLTHHAHTGKLSHCNFSWLLPRSCKVLGAAPLLVEQPSNAYSTGWQMGLQLDMQRRWDAGDRDSVNPGRVTFTAAEFSALIEPSAGIWRLTIQDVVDLDVNDVVRRFPALTSLSLSGNLGTLRNAVAINQLIRLRRLSINNLFGMTAADRPQPSLLKHLDALYLHSVPADYASAVRKAWTPEIAHGTDLEVSSPRKANWVDENRDNPLREWDGRSHISTARYKNNAT